MVLISIVSVASGATEARTNSIIEQTGTNFSGMGNVNWRQVGISTVVGGVSGFAGGSAGYLASNASFAINGIYSHVLRSVVVSHISSAASHLVRGTTSGLIQGQSIDAAFTNSLDGIVTNMAIGTVIGVGTTIGVSYATNVNPLQGIK